MTHWRNTIYGTNVRGYFLKNGDGSQRKANAKEQTIISVVKM